MSKILNNDFKKIGLITWYDNCNYGTCLQAYALQYILQNYHHTDIVKYKAKSRRYSVCDLTNSFWRTQLLWKLFDRIIIEHFFTDSTSYMELKDAKIKEFINSHLSFTEKLYDNDNLHELSDIYDIFVCGSDQIWNPTNFNPHNFLDFVNGKKRISYAPSFGVKEIENKMVRQEIVSLLEKFDYLSVREESGSCIIKKLIGKEVPVCADPTLLLRAENWMKIANESKVKIKEPFVFGLFLGRQKKHIIESQRIAETLNSRFKLLPYQPSQFQYRCDNLPASGPEDFLKCILQSDFVCTDSFHATIFAIIFHKPFVVFSRFNSSSGYSQNSRVENLLNMTGLYNRLDMSEYTPDNLLDISFDEADFNIENLRNKSLKYITESLKD